MLVVVFIVTMAFADHLHLVKHNTKYVISRVSFRSLSHFMRQVIVYNITHFSDEDTEGREGP